MKDERLVWMGRVMNLIVLIMMLASLFFGSFVLTFSIFLGFAFMKVNFWLLQMILSPLLRSSETGIKKGRFVVVLMTKYIGLIGAGALLLYYFDLHLIGLLIGMTTLVTSIGMLAMREILISKG